MTSLSSPQSQRAAYFPAMQAFRPWQSGPMHRPLYGMPQRSRPSVPRGGMGLSQQRMNAPATARMGAQQRMGQQQVPAQRAQQNFKITPSARNPPGAGGAPPVPAGGDRGPAGAMGGVSPQDSLSLQQLTSAEPHQQKQIIGEHLYRQIFNMYPQLAGKITGQPTLPAKCLSHHTLPSSYLLL